MNADMKRFEEKLTDNIASAFDAFQEEMDPGAFKDIQSRLWKRKRKVFWFPWLMRGAATFAVAIGGFLIWHLYSGTHDDTQMVTDQEMAILNDDYSAGQRDDPAQISAELNSVTSETTETYKTPSAIVPETAKKTFIQKKNSIAEKESYSSSDLSAQLSKKEQISPILQTAEIDEMVTNSLSDSATPPLPAYQVLQPLPTLTPWVFSDKISEPIFLFMPEVDILRNEPFRKESAFSLLAGIQAGMIQNQVAGNIGLKVGGRYQIPLKNGFALNMGLMASHVRLGYDPQLGSPLSFNVLELDTSIDFNSFEIEEVTWVVARLWSLEIPIQLDYSWRHSNGGFYKFSAGFSSFWQMRQRFEIDQTVYTVETDIISAQQMTITDTRRETVLEDYPPLQRFDLFAMFNLTFAFPVMIGNRYIYLEPYMQLPIGSQTSRDISYGSGGVHVVYPLYHTKTYSK